MRRFRNLKLAGLIQKELGEILIREFDFEDALVTITEVEVSEDLLQAKVRLGVIPEERKLEIMNVIEKRRKELEHKLLKKMRIRLVPKLVFEVV